MANIAFIPNPYPDELWYSVCARLGTLMWFPNQKGIVSYLYDNNFHGAISYQFGNELASIVHRDSGNLLDYSRIIKFHTLYPYYCAFLSEEKKIELFDQIVNKGKVFCSLLTRNRKKIPKYENKNEIKYCPMCLKEDTILYGEYYIHRIHQVSGAFFCTNHNVRLNSFFLPNILHIYKDINLLNLDKKIRKYNDKSDFDRFLMGLTIDSKWLLENGDEYNIQDLHDRYEYILRDSPFLLTNHRFNKTNIKNYLESKQVYFDKLSKLFNIRLDYIRQTLSLRYTENPLYHMIFCRLMDFEFKKIFIIENEYKKFSKPFGEGPWRCVNITCNEYGNNVIKEVRFKYRGERKHLKERCLGYFACPYCGFTYLVYSKDFVEGKKSDVYTIIEFGEIWEKRLRQLWNNYNYSIKQVRDELGLIYSKNLITIAKNFGLEYPRNFREELNIELSLKAMTSELDSKPSNELEVNRKRWIDLQSTFGLLGIVTLICVFGRLYRWLKKNDSVWLASNLEKVPTIIRVGDTKQNLWEKRDEECLEKLRFAFKKIYNFRRRPIKITKKTLCIIAGKTEIFHYIIKKLPKTQGFINHVVDSEKSYGIKLITWGEKQFLEKKAYPTTAEFNSFIGISSQLKVPEVRMERDRVLERLRIMNLDKKI